MAARAVIFGCRGTALSEDERDFFRASDPWGFILFARNIESPGQVRSLADALRDVVGRDAPVLIDQEGGRVARLGRPYWREWLPALEDCARLPDPEARVRAMGLRYRIIAGELRAVGIDANCAPVLDLAGEQTHAVLKNRCYGRDPDEVAAIGRAVADGLLAGGVLPVAKHMPGQGLASLDSHADLPVIAAAQAVLEPGLSVFRALSDLPMAMTAHVVYANLDPERPATLSPAVHRIIRQEIGFGGLLMTDDLSMHALSGPFETRVWQAIEAGCDMILHCNGLRAEMEAVAEAAPRLAGLPLARADAALARRVTPAEADLGHLEADYAALVRGVADA
jgi:beta-N-acetylhexosaminidase